MAPFQRKRRTLNPKRPGRKPGEGPFRHREAPADEQAGGEIRPAVKAREVSQCSKTWRGARARECHLGITRTTQRKISGSLVEAMYVKYRAARTVARAASP
ncbi:MAG: hypothetical protein HY897_18840 [Deltaproteobacteria bacterium]|nr:hypothetical protein [Deltaproteobacteria bacterium]